MDTIVALSSGRPPAAIGVVRVSGPHAVAIVTTVAGSLPEPRRAGLRALRHEGALLDRALVLVFPGPNSATGEDLIELHCHGGRAVVQAVLSAVIVAGARAAAPGEFTRRAVLNGRLDLAEAEGLADLLQAETEGQRRAALQASEGRVSRAVSGWMDRAAGLAARIELALDFDEDQGVADAESGDGALSIAAVLADAHALRADLVATLSAPPVERVRDGVRVVIAGSPNAGKSTLLNLMSARNAAIVSPVSGTTRDRIEVPVQRQGTAYLLTDTAGLIEADDPIERVGVARATEAIAAADILLWLDDEAPPRADAIRVHARADLPGRDRLPEGKTIAVRQDRIATVGDLWALVARKAVALLPTSDDLPLREWQRARVKEASEALCLPGDPLLAAEHLRVALAALADIVGVNATEATLDALFSRFCLGK